VTQRIAGASVWEQEIYDYVWSHIAHEQSIVDEYRRLAATAPSPAFRYVAELILADEVRHHRMLEDLAESIRASASLLGDGVLIPDAVGYEPDRQKALVTTEHFEAIERKDLEELSALRKKLKPVRDTTLWTLVIELMERDTEKHLRMLEFLRDHLRHPPM
jgi:hypothetical protein